VDETLAQQINIEPIWVVPKDLDIEIICLTIPKIADLLGISPSTLRGWISRKQFPPCDGRIDDRTSYWRLTTVGKYLTDAPGIRLGYPVQ